jgi:branched-subunit amino acid ABC-type transport system permease component
MNADDLANAVIGILFSISLLVVISIGLAVVFGMMGIINFAHGEFLMLGAFITLSGVRAGINIWLAMVLAALAVGAFGLLVERLLIQHLYGRLEATMLATFGLSLILVQLAVLIWGTSTQGLETPLGNFRIGRFSISEYRLVMIGAAIVLLGVVLWVFTRTRFGIMARAATQLPTMASAVGINARRINMGTFAFGAALAGAGGALLAPIVAVAPSMGSAYVARAFMTVVVGGPGVFTGTAAASGLLGSIERIVSEVSTAFLGTAALLVVAIVLLRVMPTGISGRLGRQL